MVGVDLAVVEGAVVRGGGAVGVVAVGEEGGAAGFVLGVRVGVGVGG